MADGGGGGPIAKPQRLKSSQNGQARQKKQSKLYSRFILKAVIVIFVVVIVPLVPSQAPEFFNQSILTQSWELLHLIFVGIAVSYGLFSRRNDDDDEYQDSAAEEPPANKNNKFDHAQSYVSKLLEVASSVFDDDVNSTNAADAGSSDDISKIQTWSSQYYRNEPMVVVNKENAVLDEKRVKNSASIGEQPLQLQIRRLKSRVSDSDQNGSDQLVDVNSGVSKSYRRSRTSLSSKEVPNKSSEIIRNRSLRSRVDGETGNGFMYVNEDSGGSRKVSQSGLSLSPKGTSNGSENSTNGSGSDGQLSASYNRSNAKLGTMNRTARDVNEDSRGSGDGGGEKVEPEKKEEETAVLPSPIPWRSRMTDMRKETEVPIELLISRSFNPESTLSSRSSPKTTSPTKIASSPRSSTRNPPPSQASSLESQAKASEDIGRRRAKYKTSPAPPSPPPPPPPPPPLPISSLVKPRSFLINDDISRQKEFKRSVWSEARELSESEIDELLDEANVGVEPLGRSQIDRHLMGSSVRTIRAGETIAEARRREIEAERLDRMMENDRSRNIDTENLIDQQPENKVAGDNSPPPLDLTDYPKETRDFLEHAFVETDDDDDESEAEEANAVKRLPSVPETVEEGSASNGNVTDEGPPDVDKKADEFIAKFREQIRLQRIESIKKTSGQLGRSPRR